MFEYLIAIIFIVYLLAVYFLSWVKHYSKHPQMYRDKETGKMKFYREFKLW